MVTGAEGDTLFCFTLPQSREIAARIIEGGYCDSIRGLLESENRHLCQVITTQDSSICLMEMSLDNLERINQNNQVNINQLSETLKGQQKKLRQGRWQKVLLGIALGIMTVVAVVN